MKAYGIGLIILLAAFVTSLYPAYLNYNYIMNPPKIKMNITQDMKN